MSFKKVVVAGGGVLGSQIAFQAAYCGFDVTIWLRSQGSIGRTQPKLDNLKKTYEEAIESMAAGTGPWCAGIANSDPKSIDIAWTHGTGAPPRARSRSSTRWAWPRRSTSSTSTRACRGCSLPCSRR